MKWMLPAACLLCCALLSPAFAADEAPAALSFKVKSLDGKEVDLSQFKGKVLLVVNVASRCGLTPHYEGLQALYEESKDDGLVVLGFPCNQFGKQEPGTSADIATFCSDNYSVTFPMFEKIDVNGENAAPFYQHLTSLKTPPKGDGKVAWNFEKFVIDRNGEVIARFEPRTKPSDPLLLKTLAAALAEKAGE
ncbi:glutathione peroxidase [Lignipirellula cremea]|uniref:Glutathione peroxidase n=1 Tax=Lignipirellula cremea TaxID=2528010 RepID=A0A518DVQ5_9BACT|nr:glutathione peroxidase [Lignipirellula cremea]QDU95915.1 Hydroperoxy fatty acid reductase gpx1 [Lignipirellula cremea]